MARSEVIDGTVHYPESDGLPMAETDFQRDALIDAVEALKEHFRERRDVYVSENLFLYYEEGNPRAVVAPDVFVVLGASSEKRRSYRLWQEPKGPDFVLEVTSESTRREDQGPKRELYARLGVTEYWQYDPTGDYLAPPLQGLVLEGGRYGGMPGLGPAAGRVSGYSRVLGLELRLDQDRLRFFDPAAGRYLMNLRDEAAARREEASARKAAEARVAELEAGMRALGEAPPSDKERA